LKNICQKLDIPLVFKGSYRKANRSRLDSFTGIGDEKALKVLQRIGKEFALPVVTDIHAAEEAAIAAEYVNILQIPAFLCRQTDLITAAAKTGCIVNIKKAQFLSGKDMQYPVNKAQEAGAKEVWLTERGNMMGYNNLVVDFRNIPDMLELVPTVIMDCTHSVQRPGGADGKTGGDRRFVPQMALAAKAFGATGYFFEVHPEPDKGLSDAANMLELEKLEDLVSKLVDS
jgi:2-dehydro-3-deoxyphosphooctonate aldolase (KDO 8-P synthase)